MSILGRGDTLQKALVISLSLAILVPLRWATPVQAQEMEIPEDPGPGEVTTNIIFLPGVQASRLYRPGLFGLLNKLWEPNRNADVEKLFLKDDGTSTFSDVSTYDVIMEAGGFNIYKKFFIFFDDLAEQGILQGVMPFAYDWRYSVKKVVEEGSLNIGGGRIYVLDQIRQQAANSPTGKVTIITHSNGALLAKEIIKQLGDEEASQIIDQLIMVAPPQLGTPKAITAMLHGDDQDFVGGFLVRKDTARELGEDMKSAYALLPSQEYFNRVDTNTQPLIEFDESVKNIGWENIRQQYGGAVNTYNELKNFLTGENGNRPEPPTSNVFLPTVLKKSFIEEAQQLHDEQDTWHVPEGIKVKQIVGWGLDTIRGIRYFVNTSYACPSNPTTCTPYSILDHEPLFTTDGDGTVVTPSAAAMDIDTYYVDLFSHNSELQGLRRNREHKDILEVETLQELLKSIVLKEEIIDLPRNISTTKPNGESNLIVRVHSPVKIDIYDSIGNHTGVIPNPDPNSDLKRYEEQIPNSAYYEIGEGKYITLDTEDTYQLKIQGQATGTFTLKIEETQDGHIVDSKTFTDIPVTPNTKASLTTKTVDSTSKLALDIEGDGKVDMQLNENEALNPSLNLKLIEKMIQASKISNPFKIALILELKVIENQIEKGNMRAAKLLLAVVIEELKTKKSIGISKTEAEQLIYMVQQIKNSI